jgi:hypothetical protein
MARAPSRFDRKEPRYKQQARVLVLCEDSKSSRMYLQDAANHFRAYADVEISHCGKNDPKGIVEEAVKRQRNYDHVYCAIDRDSDPKFDAALNQATHTSKVTVIASYPCYEYWLLLHFRKTRSSYVGVGKHSSGDLLVKDLRKEEGMETYDKGASQHLFDNLLPKLPTARKHAAEVLAEAHGDGALNPSTRLHELMDLFEKLGQPQPIIRLCLN